MKRCFLANNIKKKKSQKKKDERVDLAMMFSSRFFLQDFFLTCRLSDPFSEFYLLLPCLPLDFATPVFCLHMPPITTLRATSHIHVTYFHIFLWCQKNDSTFPSLVIWIQSCPYIVAFRCQFTLAICHAKKELLKNLYAQS